MTGFADYTAKNVLNYLAGSQNMPTLPALYVAAYTGVGTDAGTGFTEVTNANGYARVQIAGAITAAGSISTASSTITMPNVSGYPWVVAGMSVWDLTNNKSIGTVSSWVGTTLTLTGNAANNGSGATDSLAFSAFSAASGSAPSQITNAAVITFPQATGAGWGTVIAFGIIDSGTYGAGNLLYWDYLGNYQWLPAETSAASPASFTVKAHGYSAADSIVYTTEYGGTAPTFSQSNFTGILAVVSPTTDNFTVTNASTAVNTSTSGSGMVRKLIQQSVPGNVTMSFAASSLVVTSA